MAFANIMFLALPSFRGYLMYPTGDAMTHVGYIKDIIYTGNIGVDNFYPMVHLLAISIYYLTELKFGPIVNLLFASWYVLYLFNVYLLSTVISRCRRQAILILTLSSPLIFSQFHLLIHPSILSVFILPLFLALIFMFYKSKDRKLELNLLILIISIYIVYTHPITALYAILLIIALIFTKIIYIHIQKNFAPVLDNIDLNYRKEFNLITIMFIFFFFWYIYNSIIQKSIIRVNEAIFRGSEVSLYSHQTDMLRLADLDLLEIAELFIYKFGGVFLYISIASLVILIVYVSILRKSHISFISFYFYNLFIVTLFASIIFLFGYSPERDPIRISRFLLFLSPIIIGIGIFEYHKFHLERRSQNKFIFFIIMFLLMSSEATLNIYNVYGSHRTVTPNWQVSSLDVNGLNWSNQKMDLETIIISTHVEINLQENFLYGSEYPVSKRLRESSDPIPSHFGYDKNSSLTKTLNITRAYMLTNKLDKLFMNILPINARYRAHIYTDEDFRMLKSDDNIEHIYCNGDFDGWKTAKF